MEIEVPQPKLKSCEPEVANAPHCNDSSILIQRKKLILHPVRYKSRRI